MFQVHGFDRLGHAFRLQPVQGFGAAVLDIAEAAGACAHVAQHQEGGRAGAPAFAHVWAHGFFADGMQCLGAHQGLQVFDHLARWGAHFDPLRAAEWCGGVVFRVYDPVTGWGW